MLILDCTGNYFIIISSGRSRKFRKGSPGHLPTCHLLDTFYFSENFMKIPGIQNFKE